MKKPPQTLIEKVRAFHEKFGVPVADSPQGLTQEVSDFRIKFMREELEEYERAVESGDITKQFDALIDLVYVALGTALWQGFPFDDGFDIVHVANMAKKRAERKEQSTRGTTFDVIKPAGWVAPDSDLADLLEAAR